MINEFLMVVFLNKLLMLIKMILFSTITMFVTTGCEILIIHPRLFFKVLQWRYEVFLPVMNLMISSCYTAISVYYCLTLLSSPNPNEVMSWSWKLKFPRNVYHFTWIIMYGKLPINQVWCSHHISQNASCYRHGA